MCSARGPAGTVVGDMGRSTAAVEDPPADPAPAGGRIPRRTLVRSVVLATVAALVAAVIAVALLSGDDPEQAVTELQPAETVPDMGMERLDGEGELRFADFAGSPLVVNFFSSTCVPCRAEMPDLQQVHTELGDQVTFVGVDVQDDPDAGRALVADTGVTYVTGSDPTGEIFNAFGGTLLPVTAFVHPDGTILSVHTGRLTADELRTTISQQLLAGG